MKFTNVIFGLLVALVYSASSQARASQAETFEPQTVENFLAGSSFETSLQQLTDSTGSNYSDVRMALSNLRINRLASITGNGMVLTVAVDINLKGKTKAVDIRQLELALMKEVVQLSESRTSELKLINFVYDDIDTDYNLNGIDIVGGKLFFNNDLMGGAIRLTFNVGLDVGSYKITSRDAESRVQGLVNSQMPDCLNCNVANRGHGPTGSGISWLGGAREQAGVSAQLWKLVNLSFSVQKLDLIKDPVHGNNPLAIFGAGGFGSIDGTDTLYFSNLKRKEMKASMDLNSINSNFKPGKIILEGSWREDDFKTRYTQTYTGNAGLQVYPPSSSFEVNVVDKKVKTINFGIRYNLD